MTAKVVDASALAAVIFVEPKSSVVQATLLGCDLHAPAVLGYEIANVCTKKVRARPDERDLILGQHKASLSIPVTEHLVDQPEIVLLSVRFSLSAYDASYLWLALRLGVELVTLDEKLQKAAVKSGIQSLS